MNIASGSWGWIFHRLLTKYGNNYEAWHAYGKIYGNFFYENYPILDENGLAIDLGCKINM